MTRLAIVASHPVQYHAPLFRELARRMDLTVFYGHRDTKDDQARAGFGTGFSWDVDLLSGYNHVFLENRAKVPGLHHFAGVDTPQIGKLLGEGRFDAVMILGWFLKSFIQALFAAKLRKIPVLLRGDSQLGSPRSAMKKAAKAIAYPPFLRLFDAALVAGQRNRAYWRHYHYPEQRIFSSPHCIDTHWFSSRATPAARLETRKRLGVQDNTCLALFAGKLVEFKRPLDLLDGAAAARKAGADVEVLVAGSGPLEEIMRQRAHDLAVPVHFLGFCNQSEMPAAYAAADVLVLPSDGRETWGLVVNEAAACGTPAIVSDAAGCAPDIAARLGDAWLFACGDTSQLAERLAHGALAAANLSIFNEAFSLVAAVNGIEQAILFLRTGNNRHLA